MYSILVVEKNMYRNAHAIILYLKTGKKDIFITLEISGGVGYAIHNAIMFRPLWESRCLPGTKNYAL